MITDFEYLDDLRTIRYRESPNAELFFVLADFRVKFKIDDEPIIYTVPADTPINGPDIPRFFQRYIRLIGASFEPSAVHDHMCQTKPWTSDIAADIFYAALIANEEPKAWQMWKAVKWGGPKW